MLISDLNEFNSYPPKQYISTYNDVYYQIKSDLPNLVGKEKWHFIGQDFERRLNKLEFTRNKRKRRAQSKDLANIFVRYPDARSRIIFQVRTTYIAHQTVKWLTYLLTVPRDKQEEKIGINKINKITKLFEGLVEKVQVNQPIKRILDSYESAPNDIHKQMDFKKELAALMTQNYEIYDYILQFSDTILPGKRRIQPPPKQPPKTKSQKTK